MTDFQVGQQLYYVREGRNSQQGYLTIEKVGRKWLTCKFNTRVCKDKLFVDGGDYASPGQCWLSEEDYRNDRALKKAWNEFRSKAVVWNLPVGVTLEKIQQASALLFGD